MIFVDTRVAGHDSIVLEAGSHEDSIRIASEDLIRVAGAQVAEICADE